MNGRLGLGTSELNHGGTETGNTEVKQRRCGLSVRVIADATVPARYAAPSLLDLR